MDKEQLVSLHAIGMTNRQIAAQMSVSHAAVAYWMNKLELVANGRARGFRETHGDQSRCSVCRGWFLTTSFPRGRSGTDHEYYLTYCRTCRTDQSYSRLNENPIAFLSDRWRKVGRRARASGVPFTISLDEWLDQYHKQNGLCFYTDEPLVMVVGSGKQKNALSVDKVVPALGYVTGNVVFCTNRVNTMKNDMTPDEMKKWTPSWYDRVVELERYYDEQH